MEAHKNNVIVMRQIEKEVEWHKDDVLKVRYAIELRNMCMLLVASFIWGIHVNICFQWNKTKTRDAFFNG